MWGEARWGRVGKWAGRARQPSRQTSCWPPPPFSHSRAHTSAIASCTVCLLRSWPAAATGARRVPAAILVDLLAMALALAVPAAATPLVCAPAAAAAATALPPPPLGAGAAAAAAAAGPRAAAVVAAAAELWPIADVIVTDMLVTKDPESSTIAALGSIYSLEREETARPVSESNRRLLKSKLGLYKR